MLETIAIILVVMWLLGMVTAYTMGGLIHILLVLAIITINKRTGKVESAPEVVTRGFVTGEIALGDQAREIVNRTLESSSAEEKADYGVMKEKIRLDLKRYIQKSTSRRPMIMPIILEI